MRIRSNKIVGYFLDAHAHGKIPQKSFILYELYSSQYLTCSASFFYVAVDMGRAKPWHLRSENGYVFMYKGDETLDRSECLGSGGKASGNATKELGPVLAVKAVDGQLKVPITNSVWVLILQKSLPVVVYVL